MRKLFLTVVFFLILQTVAFSQEPKERENRINFGFDFNRTTLTVFDKSQEFSWKGGEVSFEQEWKENKLIFSGFSAGVRFEGRIYDGTYVKIAFFRRLGHRGILFYPGISVLYGIPGVNFNQTWEEKEGWKQVGYVHLYPMRNANIPGKKVENFGWIYPEPNLTARKKFGRFNIDARLGLRIMRFGATQSDFYIAHSITKTVFVPTFGMNAGIKF